MEGGAVVKVAATLLLSVDYLATVAGFLHSEYYYRLWWLRHQGEEEQRGAASSSSSSILPRHHRSSPPPSLSPSTICVRLSLLGRASVTSGTTEGGVIFLDLISISLTNRASFCPLRVGSQASGWGWSR
ncbi:unnamed protein product [Cuscuta campestris]|uniref:Uncharacterized protein n=1 Tax=Cuscuta campestris TaxID=132261 RepID=A0A484LYQ2_9ASTE|nr:unnamed protein product [Cuscuta campestris]